jgi:hypothetical protein
MSRDESRGEEDAPGKERVVNVSSSSGLFSSKTPNPKFYS